MRRHSGWIGILILTPIIAVIVLSIEFQPKDGEPKNIQEKLATLVIQQDVTETKPAHDIGKEAQTLALQKTTPADIEKRFGAPSHKFTWQDTEVWDYYDEARTEKRQLLFGAIPISNSVSVTGNFNSFAFIDGKLVESPGQPSEDITVLGRIALCRRKSK